MSKINLQEPQRNRNATANFVNLIMTSTVMRGVCAYITICVASRNLYKMCIAPCAVFCNNHRIYNTITNRNLSRNTLLFQTGQFYAEDVTFWRTCSFKSSYYFFLAPLQVTRSHQRKCSILSLERNLAQILRV